MASRTITDRGADAAGFRIERTAGGFEVNVEIRTTDGGLQYVTLSQADILAAVPVASDRTTTRTVLGLLYARALSNAGFA